MKTIWGEKLPEQPLSEYPRPQLKRNSYICLNGAWDYAFTKSDEKPGSFDGSILVPFSPESELSGVSRTLSPEEYLWYEKSFQLPEGFNRGRVLLHFGAVDQIAKVFVNGALVCEHVGGYTPFSADITGELSEKNTIAVMVKDFTDTSYHSRGKQSSHRGEIWYTPQSGIWQTVWMESVPDSYIKGLKITPLFDRSAVELTVIADGEQQCAVEFSDGRSFLATSGKPAVLDMPDFVAWSPEKPYLYGLSVRMGDDQVESYFGMRKFSVDVDDKGKKRLFLNNAPYFHNGLLDQGYYPDGLYTAPDDEAMIFDIKLAKAYGFNMLRKHIKLEPLRWYYHCDRLGMLVWQDMINGGGSYKFTTISVPLVTGKSHSDSDYKAFAREDGEGREQYYRELTELVETLYNSVSVAMWVPFNEGWGQFDSKKAFDLIRSLDDTRTIDHASGWHDQKIGDIKSLHVYFRKYRHKNDKLGRAVVLSEFGGYNCRLEGHTFGRADFGYKKTGDKNELLKNYKRLYCKEIIPAKKSGLCATVYTQLTDVEDELNGLVTYDRRAEKLPADELKIINAQINDRSR